MHDVLSREERRALMTANPYTYMHVARQSDDTEQGTDPGAEAAAALARLLAVGAFEHLPVPSLYLYRLTDGDHTQTGVVGEIPVEAFLDGRVRGHEAVQSHRVEALVQHHQAVAGRSALVALMYRSDPRISALVAESCAETPILRIVDDVHQEVWRVGHPRALEAISGRIGGQVLYITDGHHRVASAVEEWKRAGKPEGRRVLCAVFPDTELRTYAFHRRVRGPIDLERLRRSLDLAAADGPVREKGRFGLYVGGRWYAVRPDTGDRALGAEGLDVAALHRQVLAPVLGVEGVDDPRLEVASDLQSLADLISRCDEDGGALFILCPPSFSEIMEVSDRGEVLPAKSTYFDPKPRAGVFLRFPGE
jgi:uncharacterized protein (DUF1015 family)